MRRVLTIALFAAVASLQLSTHAQQPAPGSGAAPAAPQTVPAPQAPPSPREGGPSPAFRAGIDIVSLNVTVTDGTNRYITDLEQTEFSVFEDGVKQELTFFNRRPRRQRRLRHRSSVRAGHHPRSAPASTSFRST